MLACTFDLLSIDLDRIDPFYNEISDSDEEIELFEQERYSQKTPENVNSLRREVSPDSKFRAHMSRIKTKSRPVSRIQKT